MSKDKRDIRSFLVKVGVAIAVSVAGFLYSRLKTRKTRPPQSPGSPCTFDIECENNVEHGALRRDDKHVARKIPLSGSITSTSAERCEDPYVLKVSVDNSVVVSPKNRHSGDKDRYLLPEFNDLVKEFDFSATTAEIAPKRDVETPRSDADIPRAVRRVEKDAFEQEIRHLKNLVRTLREREKNLEVQLLEFYGLKEQEAAMMELKNRLNINNMEAKFLALKIESLQADNHRLQEQAAEHARVVAELDAARAKIKLLKKKLRSEAEQNKEQILCLQKSVSKLQEQDLKAAEMDSEMKLQLQRLKDLETEAEELRESNSRLHLENAELANQLESTQILANSVLEDPETEALRVLGNQLRQENEDLAKEVERLQSGHCSDVEELVYLRWINACLRYELRNFQPMHGKTVARDLSKSLSPKSEKKAKQLILEYANSEGIGDKGVNIMDFESENWSSSQTSSNTDLAELDDSSLSSKTNSSSKIKFLNKLMRVIRGKDTSYHNRGSSEDRTGGTEDYDLLNGHFSISTMTDTVGDMQSRRVDGPSLCTSGHSSRRSAEFQKLRSLKMDGSKVLGSTGGVGSSGHSLDIQRFRSLKIDDMKDIESGSRSSEGRASSVYTRFSSGRKSGRNLSLEDILVKDVHSFEKSELAKYAEALKDSGSRSHKSHRKWASLGSLESYGRSTSR